MNSPESAPGIEHFPTKDRLHSDVLEDRYGPIHSEVLRHDDVRAEDLLNEHPVREAHLCDTEGISRTYALTFLTYDKNNDELYEIDREIRDGGMIGKTFRDHGYEIRKNVIDVFTLPLTHEMKRKFKTDEKYGKARISEFYAKKSADTPLIYGRVLELYTPDFRGPIINTVDIDQVNPSTEVMERYGISKDVIWNHLDEASKKDEWSDMKDSYEHAKEESLPEVFEWRDRITDFLNTKE